MKLEFGNPEHIKKAQAGVMCRCGHAQGLHSPKCGATKYKDEVAYWNEDGEQCECLNFKR